MINDFKCYIIFTWIQSKYAGKTEIQVRKECQINSTHWDKFIWFANFTNLYQLIDHTIEILIQIPLWKGKFMNKCMPTPTTGQPNDKNDWWRILFVVSREPIAECIIPRDSVCLPTLSMQCTLHIWSFTNWPTCIHNNNGGIAPKIPNSINIFHRFNILYAHVFVCPCVSTLSFAIWFCPL